MRRDGTGSVEQYISGGGGGGGVKRAFMWRILDS
jgi:hypothetical protein